MAEIDIFNSGTAGNGITFHSFGNADLDQDDIIICPMDRIEVLHDPLKGYARIRIPQGWLISIADRMKEQQS